MALLARRQKTITEQVLGAAIEVHRILGPGLLESAYRGALAKELDLRGIRFEREVEIPLKYKHAVLVGTYRLDFLIEGDVVVELTCVEKLLPIHEAQLLTYLRLGRYPVGLLVNFNVPLLMRGVRRMLL